MRARLLGLVERFPRQRTIVVGDIAADEFLYGRVARVSREAPVLILEYDTTHVVAGSAGNAANNVAALGGGAQLFGCLGRDEAGERLVASFLPGVDTRALVKLPGYATPTKTRVLAGGIHSAKQQVVRIDRRQEPVPVRDVHAAFEARLERALATCHAQIPRSRSG
jgi:bifunctional ADP-heptose synthase (sugar kinase/adenylyltransferase)